MEYTRSRVKDTFIYLFIYSANSLTNRRKAFDYTIVNSCFSFRIKSMIVQSNVSAHTRSGNNFFIHTGWTHVLQEIPDRTYINSFIHSLRAQTIKDDGCRFVMRSHIVSIIVFYCSTRRIQQFYVKKTILK